MFHYSYFINDVIAMLKYMEKKIQLDNRFVLELLIHSNGIPMILFTVTVTSYAFSITLDPFCIALCLINPYQYGVTFFVNRH